MLTLRSHPVKWDVLRECAHTEPRTRPPSLSNGTGAIPLGEERAGGGHRAMVLAGSLRVCCKEWMLHVAEGRISIERWKLH